MLKKYIVVISANLLLNVAFNSSPFGVHALDTLTERESSNAGEEHVSINYEPPEQDSSEACDYTVLEEYSDCGNIANEKSNNEKDVEPQGSNKSMKSEENGTQTEEEEEEKVEQGEGNYHDASHIDGQEQADGQNNDNELAGEHIVQEVNGDVVVLNENTYSIEELEDPLDSYRTLYSILFAEFETTKTYLTKIMNCTTDEEKNELLEDHIGILKEMYENSKQIENFRLPFEIRDSMALRISDRLRDFCFSEYLTDSNILTLQSLFLVELEVFKGLFYYLKHKNTYSERKEVINDLELIKLYHEELITENGLHLTDEQLDNAAMRVSNFVHDLYFMCFSNYQNMLIFREIRDAILQDAITT
ncbi:Uncharacterized protein PCOAH_00008150 [Plasmodium coatneyi]|uniref:Gamete antigen 27/25 n=1 Tax=Plasmodium coatneyi TaxID=208452 RepID=A0A1B1DV43_9APIC|nr:Uncharacterized protein PCOAH_00008150 [Plasmodium coatneyi]ANQ06648.1 Uncharacterized protein PCOAH_00008150 [Plasmodium coatneyi]